MQLNQPCSYGKFNQFSSRVHVKFVHDPLTVAGNSLWAEGELLPDLEIIQPMCHEFKYLALA